MQEKNKGIQKQQKKINLYEAEKCNQSKSFDPAMNNLYVIKM